MNSISGRSTMPAVAGSLLALVLLAALAMVASSLSVLTNALRLNRWSV